MWFLMVLGRCKAQGDHTISDMVCKEVRMEGWEGRTAFGPRRAKEAQQATGDKVTSRGNPEGLLFLPFMSTPRDEARWQLFCK